MTIGSAAFLSGPAPATPLPAFGSFEPRVVPRVFSGVLPGTASPRRAPPALATDDGPCGRLLVAEPRPLVALGLQRILREAGYGVVGPASTLGEARRLVRRGAIGGAPVDGAIVDLDLAPAVACAIVEFLEQAGIPMVFLSGPALDALPERHCRRPLVAKPYTGAGLLQAVRQALAGEGDGDGEGDDAGDILYPLSPPTISWPRVFPQL